MVGCGVLMPFPRVMVLMVLADFVVLVAATEVEEPPVLPPSTPAWTVSCGKKKDLGATGGGRGEGLTDAVVRVSPHLFAVASDTLIPGLKVVPGDSLRREDGPAVFVLGRLVELVAVARDAGLRRPWSGNSIANTRAGLCRGRCRGDWYHRGRLGFWDAKVPFHPVRLARDDAAGPPERWVLHDAAC